MTPNEFVAKWHASELKERSAAQEHFIDLCRLLGEPTPAEADPKGDHAERTRTLELSRFHGRLVSVVDRIRCPFPRSLSSRWREAVCVRPDARDEAGGGPGAAGSPQAARLCFS